MRTTKFIEIFKIKLNSSQLNSNPKKWIGNRLLFGLFGMMLGMLTLLTSYAQETTNQSPKEVTTPADPTPSKNRQVPIEFETVAGLKNISPSTVFAGAYYYSNADDDPAIGPKVGDDNGIKYIQISSIRGNSKSVASTQSYLTRWVKVPDNAPQRIKVSFKTKVSKNDNFDWAPKGPSGTVRRKVTFSVDFLRPDGLEGGGLKLNTSKLTDPLDKWVSHSEVIAVPKNAKYLKIAATTSGGYNLALGDWKIE
jgi:hypothetical protein